MTSTPFQLNKKFKLKNRLVVALRQQARVTPSKPSCSDITWHNLKILKLASLLIILSFSWGVKAEIKPFIPDTTVARLMNNFQYRDAANIINARLRKANNRNTDERLYYNNQLSMSYIRLLLADSALIHARQSLHLLVLSVDSSLISDGWKVASYSYNRTGELDSAIFYTNLMLKYGERNGDKRLIRNSVNSLGTIMNQNNRSSEALKYFQKAYSLTEELKDSTTYPTMLFNLGLTYNYLNKHDSALYYLEKSRDYALKEKHYEQALYAYSMLSDTYLELNDFRKWKENTIELYNLAEQRKSKEYMAHAYNRLLYGFIKSKEYREAISYGKKALDILKVSTNKSLQIAVDSGMYVAYKSVGDYKEAAEYLEKFFYEKYSMLSENGRKQLDEMQVKFSIKEKNLTIAQQKLELTNKQKNIQLLLFVLVLFVFAVVVSVIYVIRNHRFRRELYKKEKYLENQLADTKQWMEGVFLKDSFIPTVFKQLPYEGETCPVEQDLLSPQSILYSELRETIEKQKLYLNPELNLQMVVKLLGTNKKYLYQAISSNTDNNFRNFINRYRIDHAKRLIEDDVTNKTNSNLSELFNLCGFNNVSTYFRTFKTITGLTPKEYATEVERDNN